MGTSYFTVVSGLVEIIDSYLLPTHLKIYSLGFNFLQSLTKYHLTLCQRFPWSPNLKKILSTFPFKLPS